MSKHTPGPWFPAEGSYGNYVAIKAQPHFGSSKAMTVARVPWGKIGTGYDSANASLIAAAPIITSEEMDNVLVLAYAAAQAIECGVNEVKGTLYTKDDVKDAYQAVKVVQQAIAKARGE